jgi:hypothetical protein
MIFQSTDDGPFWMTPAEREQWRNDFILEDQVVKKELRKKSFQSGYLHAGLP